MVCNKRAYLDSLCTTRGSMKGDEPRAEVLENGQLARVVRRCNPVAWERYGFPGLVYTANCCTLCDRPTFLGCSAPSVCL